jgi:hypothetical protein
MRAWLMSILIAPSFVGVAHAQCEHPRDLYKSKIVGGSLAQKLAASRLLRGHDMIGRNGQRGQCVMAPGRLPAGFRQVSDPDVDPAAQLRELYCNRTRLDHARAEAVEAEKRAATDDRAIQEHFLLRGFGHSDEAIRSMDAASRETHLENARAYWRRRKAAEAGTTPDNPIVVRTAEDFQRALSLARGARARRRFGK